jgi:hypothetical protein
VKQFLCVAALLATSVACQKAPAPAATSASKSASPVSAAPTTAAGQPAAAHPPATATPAPPPPKPVPAQFPDVVASAAGVTGHAIDSSTSTIYAQVPTAGVAVPVLSIVDQDNLTERERLRIPENMIGRALLSSNGKTLYAVSESGVMALPVGSLNQYARIAASDQDVLAQSGYCDRRVIVKSLTITDPGGGSTDFSITVNQPGVTVSPTSGVTPATVQVRVDPSAFQGRSGTTAVTLQLTSDKAVNFPRPVRVLVSAPEPDQRGTIINVPGRLTDLLADSQRNRVYVLRQDGNELMVFEGSRFT